MNWNIGRRTFLRIGGASVAGLASPIRALAQGGTPSAFAPVVATVSGRVRGVVQDGVHVYRGIPYAAPPTGSLRFMAPAPPVAWSGIRDMVTPGPRAPQPVRLMIPEMGDALTGSGPTGEDCLRLHVWTPDARPGGARRPVMVFFHGGGFRSGSANSVFYDGRALARKHDVVLVTVNHRLNALGYLYLEKLGGERYAQSGNAGLLDLVAALRWVRDNIEAFGGNPGNVTLLGQSGGGGKVAMLTATPAAKGLFHRAIIMSTLIDSGVRALDAAEAQVLAEIVMQRLGVPRGQVDALQKLPVDQLITAVTGAGGIARGTTPDERLGDDISARLYPVVDGHTLSSYPYDPVAPAVSADVPILCGSNETEGVPYADLADPFWQGEIETDEALRARVRTVLRVGDTEADQVIALYRRNRPRDSRGDIALIIAADNSPTRLASYVFADRKFALGRAPSYLYYFDWRSPVRGGKLRTMHSMELPFLFDHVDDIPFMTGTGPDRYALATRMSDAFVSFARTGVPSVAGVPAWPAYDPVQRATMMFGTECRLANDPYGAERRALETIRVRRATGQTLSLRMGFRVRDPEATARFWTALGATRATRGEVIVMRVAGIEILLSRGTPSGSSEGAVVNHIGLRVPEFATLLDALTAAGMRTERPAQFPGTLNAFTPDGDKVEIFNNTSTSPGFVPAGEPSGQEWQRHNAPVSALSAHHLHFYLPEGQDAAAQAWYLARFGGTPETRLRYVAIDYPGINLNFSTAPAPAGPTAGRSLDRIGFSVPDLETLCRGLAASATVFERAYARDGAGVATALLKDPWGTSIELTEAGR